MHLRITINTFTLTWGKKKLNYITGIISIASVKCLDERDENCSIFCNQF